MDHGTNLGCTTMMSHAGWKWEAWGPFSWSYLFDSGKLLLFLFLSKKWSTRHFGILKHQKKKQIQRFMVDHAGLHQSPNPGRKLHSLAHGWAQLCGWGVQWPIRLICLSLCSCLYRYDSICLYHFILVYLSISRIWHVTISISVHWDLNINSDIPSLSD